MNDLRKLPTDRILVSPSVLACDFSRLGEEIARADVVHIGELLETELPLSQLKKLVFPHPTVSEVIREGLFML